MVEGCKDDITKYRSKISVGVSVYLILLLLSIITCGIIFGYKKYVEKSLETSIDTKVQTQTIFSLGQYQIFQDSNIQKKTDDSFELTEKVVI